jgi:hypothetical protein
LRTLSASGATVTSKHWEALYEEALIFVAVGCIADGTCCWRRNCHRKARCTYECRYRDFRACHAAGIEAASAPARRRYEDGAVPLVTCIARVARFALFIALTNRQRHEKALVSDAADGVACRACRRRSRGQCEARHADKHISTDRSVRNGRATCREAARTAAREQRKRRSARPTLLAQVALKSSLTLLFALT